MPPPCSPLLRGTPVDRSLLPAESAASRCLRRGNADTEVDVDNLPTEVMVDIFMKVVAMDSNSMCGFSPVDRLRAPMLMTQVCWRWREIALEASPLWHSLVIACLAHEFGQGVHECTLAWVSRARGGLRSLGLVVKPLPAQDACHGPLVTRVDGTIPTTVDLAITYSTLTRLFMDSIPISFLVSLDKGLFLNLQRLALSLTSRATQSPFPPRKLVGVPPSFWKLLLLRKTRPRHHRLPHCRYLRPFQCLEETSLICTRELKSRCTRTILGSTYGGRTPKRIGRVQDGSHIYVGEWEWRSGSVDHTVRPQPFQSPSHNLTSMSLEQSAGQNRACSHLRVTLRSVGRVSRVCLSFSRRHLSSTSPPTLHDNSLVFSPRPSLIGLEAADAT
ncbi:hypothetical protein NMY22_g6083 [Coprinellus aureogranulatus]|nr:hypothetical protein NMY22_g6083 [Coprinellus aureogranulatus]